MNCSIRAIVSAFVIVANLTSQDAARAGTTGVVNGYVYDRSGRPLRGADVEIFNLADPSESRWDVDARSSESKSTTTNPKGHFVFVSLQAGYYMIQSKLAGQHLYCPPRLIVDADQTTFVSFRMDDRRLLVRCLPLHYVEPLAESR
jgi:protocatechuate 3,4-dioxygenase beta subunit